MTGQITAKMTLLWLVNFTIALVLFTLQYQFCDQDKYYCLFTSNKLNVILKILCLHTSAESSF